MVSILIVVAALFVKTISAQNFQPCQQPPPALVPTSAAINGYSIELCKNLANTVQNLVLDRLARNAYNKPVFNQIAGPMLNDISIRSQGCPLCGLPSNANQVITPPGLANQGSVQYANVQNVRPCNPVNQAPVVNQVVTPLANQVAVNQVITPPGLANQGLVQYANVQNVRPCNPVNQAPVVNQVVTPLANQVAVNQVITPQGLANQAGVNQVITPQGLANRVAINQGLVQYANVQNVRPCDGNPVQVKPCGGGNVVQNVQPVRPVSQNVVQNQQYAFVNGLKGQNGCGCSRV